MTEGDRIDELNKKKQIYSNLTGALVNAYMATDVTNPDSKKQYALGALSLLWDVPTALGEKGWRASLKGVKEEILRGDISKIKEPAAYVLLDSELKEYKRRMADTLDAAAKSGPVQAYLINAVSTGSPADEMENLENILRTPVSDAERDQYINDLAGQISDPASSALAKVYMSRTVSKEAVKAAKVTEKVESMKPSDMNAIESFLNGVKSMQIEQGDDESTIQNKLNGAGEAAIKLGRAFSLMAHWEEVIKGANKYLVYLEQL